MQLVYNQYLEGVASNESRVRVTKVDREKRLGKYAHVFYGGLRAADIRALIKVWDVSAWHGKPSSASPIAKFNYLWLSNFLKGGELDIYRNHVTAGFQCTVPIKAFSKR